VSDEVFGGRVNADVMWERVVHANAARGAHAPDEEPRERERQRQEAVAAEGHGRARVGSIRNPLWRHGGTVFGPQPRSYDYSCRRSRARALRAALAQKLKTATWSSSRR